MDNERSLSKYNARAITAFFCRVDENEFKLIKRFKSAKAAWNILKNSYKGNTNVKKARLDQLASCFKNLNMDPDKIIMQLVLRSVQFLVRLNVRIDF